MVTRNPQSVLIYNIDELAVVPPGPVAGLRMGNVPTIRRAAVLIEDELIRWFGLESDLPESDGARVIDAGGGCVTPGLIDCHTHAIFAGTRENEFIWRLQGKTYSEIAAEGGGIVVTVEAVRAASKQELVELALPRLRRMLAGGVTTVEIKSGYGLTVEDEIKMLEAAVELGRRQPVEVVTTFLGAHTTPKEYQGRPDEYLDLITKPALLERIRDGKLAEFCDAFCESGVFDVAQSERYFRTCAEYGLRPKVHADQIAQIGASSLAARLGAVSADHLEQVTDQAIDAMTQAGTVGVLLPGASAYLNAAPPPARRMMERGMAVALATDLNPGSSPVESLAVIMSLSCLLMKMTPAEALTACTANAAAALDRQDRIGAVAEGFQADLLILDVPRFEQWAYFMGRNCVAKVIKRGKLVAENP